MQYLNIGKVCCVSDAVAVGLVGETVMVGELVGDNVAVAGTVVCVVVGITVIVEVDVDSTGGGGVEKEYHANATKRMMPITMGIAYLRSADEIMAVVLLNGVTSGGLPVKPSGERRVLKLSSYSPTEKLTKFIVFSANGTLQGVNMIGMIFLRKLKACVYSLRTHSDAMESGVRTTIM